MNAIHTTRLLAAAAALTMAAALLPGAAYAMPPGEGSPTDNEAVAHSTKTRAERKAETIEARRNGELPAGGLGLYKSHMSQQSAMARSTKTRAERKAETQEAAKQHKLMPAGEAADPAKT